jgi:perosamine synthetase
MVTTGDEEIADRIRRMRLHGMSRDAWKRYLPGGAWRYEVDTAGLKANMTDIQAAIGRAQLTALSDWQQRRSELADRYDHQLFAAPGITRPARPARGLHAWHLYVIKVDPRRAGTGRDEFMEEMSERGIGTSVHFIPVHQQPYFQRLLGDGVRTGFPVCDKQFDRILSLPLHPGLSDGDVDRVCEAVLDVVSHPRVPRPRTKPDVLTVPAERTSGGVR